ncbi:MAG: GNAT family N-acetyltransferase [Candidatus Atribacteria bacterium]|nr:GNAT family N-acetyltransferase [Candidatus Atribacteria bacterium]
MIVIKSPKTLKDFTAYYDLRYRILRQPLDQPKGTEKDDYEPISYHIMAVDEETGEVVGVVKLFEKALGVGQLSHMAVAENRQGQGIGRLLVDAVDSKARELGFKKYGMTARENVIDFYKKCGHHVVKISYVLHDQVQLLWMEKDL